jgi:lysophospholipase L1-like esterase
VSFARTTARLVGFGDSFLAKNDDQVDAGVHGPSFMTYTCALSGGKLVYARNAGVGGNRSADSLARFDTDVKPYRPDVLLVHLGINDISNSVPLATYQSNMRTIVTKGQALGALVVVCAIPPDSTISGISQWNYWLQQFCQDSGALFADTYRALVDPTTGALKTSLSQGDGRHPNMLGFGYLAQVVSDLVTPLLSKPAPTVLSTNNVDPANMLSNALALNGGNAPTYWSKVGALGTTAQSVAAATEYGVLGNWLTTMLDGSGAQTTDVDWQQTVYMSNNATPTLADGRPSPIQPGDRMGLSVRFKASGLTGPAKVTAYLYSTPSFQYARALGLIYPLSGVGQIDLEYTIPAGDNRLLVYLRADILNASLPPGAGNNVPNLNGNAGGTISFAQPTLLDFTRLGLTARQSP